MALITVCAGAYVGSYAARTGLGTAATQSSPVLIGVTRSGYTLSWAVHSHEIRKTISYRLALIEGIYMGADWSVQFTAREALYAGVLRMMWPWGALDSELMTTIYPVRMGSPAAYFDRAGALVLTSTSATPAEASPATFTASKALPIPIGQGQMTFDSTARELSLSAKLLPYEVSTSYQAAGEPAALQQTVWFVTT